jgi:hypothetical protein
VQVLQARKNFSSSFTLYTRNSSAGTFRANSWIFTLSPGANVREVDSENDRGASFALAGIAAQTAISNAATPAAIFIAIPLAEKLRRVDALKGHDFSRA